MKDKPPKEQSSYRQIIKATSLFGGVQVYNIIISIIRSKFIAILLGPAGMGIAGLLGSTTGLIRGLTDFGLSTSAVKDVASANSTGNKTRIATIVTVLRRWLWITGLLGMLITVVFSSWLSQLTFGNRNYTMAFIWISITLLFNQLCDGQLVILQGLRKLQYLAKANMSGSLLALFITIPLYYIWDIDAIVPAIIITSLISLLLSWYFAHKLNIETIKVTRVRTLAEGKDMLVMGFMLSLSGIVTLGTSYIVRIFISNTGGVAQVGLYNAGFAIINTYVGLIFTAMGTDYYPRLSALAKSPDQSKLLINQQAEVAILILAPIIMIFLVYIHWIVILLFSNKFIEVNEMIHWAALGMFFKSASWAIAFILLAKGASKLYFWNEFFASTYMLGFNILGYQVMRMTGLGISFFFGYLIYLIQVFLVSNIKFRFSFNSTFIRIFVLQFTLALSCFIVIKFIGNPYSYIIGTVLILVSSVYSFKELDKRIGLKAIFITISNRYLKK
jgi:O-antigen/teichoic acid export membrane protein